MNTLKTVFLMGMLGLAIVLLGRFIGGTIGMVVATVLAVLINGFGWYYSKDLAFALGGAHQLAQNERPELRAMIEELAHKANIPTPDMYIIHSNGYNAFAAGRNPANSGVAITQGLLQLLSPDEVKAVMAHEIGHIQRHHILIGSVTAMMVSMITIISDLVRWFGFSRDNDRIHPLAAFVLSLVAPLAATLVQLAISRTNEFEADEVGGYLCGNPLALASALEKLEQAARLVPLQTSPALTHMYIVKPNPISRMLNWFSTHPLTCNRVAKLQKQARAMGIA